MTIIRAASRFRREEGAPVSAHTLIPTWQTYLTTQQHRPRGVRSYGEVARLVLRALGDPTVEALCSASIARLRAEWLSTLHPGTVRNRLTILRSFCDWLIASGYRADNPLATIPNPHVPLPDPNPLSMEQVATLRAILANPQHCKPYHAARNARACGLMLYAGLRIQEVAGLRREGVDLDRRTLRVSAESAKGGRARSVPISSELATLLATMPAALGPGDPVVGQGDVPGRWAKPLTVKSLAHLFERWLPSEGLVCSAHQLRRTFATQLYLHGVHLITIQRLLGHSDPATTQRYIGHVSQVEREAVEALNWGK